jgi:hypothetical protein
MGGESLSQALALLSLKYLQQHGKTEWKLLHSHKLGQNVRFVVLQFLIAVKGMSE